MKGGYTANYRKKDEKHLKEIVLSMLPDAPSGLNSRDISLNTGLASRDVRYVIQKLRDDGHPICATPEKGYWIAQYSWEMKETIDKLHSHMMNCMATVEVLEIARDKLKEKEGIK